MVFIQDMILPTKDVAYWKLICQRKQAKKEEYVICKKLTRTDPNYRVGDQVLLKNKSAYKYEDQFKGL